MPSSGRRSSSPSPKKTITCWRTAATWLGLARAPTARRIRSVENPQTRERAMGIERDSGIVIRSIKLGEADRIISFCTPRFGKVRGVARGSRRPKSRMGASLELFNVGELVFVRKANRDLDSISSFDVSDAHGSRLRDPLRVAYASYLAELTSEFVVEEDASPALFALICDAVRAVESTPSGTDLAPIARSFEMKLLTLAGYGPHLRSCVRCGAPLADGEVPVGIDSGGALCARHASQDRTVVVSRGSIDAWQYLAATPVEDAAGRSLTRREGIELRHLGTMMVSHRTERPLRCVELIEALESEAASGS
ncbi:DNA repair protein RecO [Candidatus Poribacteria bacterium]|nr:DNA repair protein RecO [Candidatus Poribacteria bacterium]